MAQLNYMAHHLCQIVITAITNIFNFFSLGGRKDITSTILYTINGFIKQVLTMPKQCKRTPKLGETSRGRKDKPVNPWPCKTELPILAEMDKLILHDIPFLECQGAFKVKPVGQLNMDDHMYNIFHKLVNQEPSFMHQWVRVYTLMHKKQVHGTSTKYIQSRGLKLPDWLNEVKDGKPANILAIYILCKATQMHCFVHINGGISSSLHEDPISHQEYVQRCNLHLLYLGSSVYAELEACTEIIQYKIFGVTEPLPIELNVNKPAVGTLSPSEIY